MATVYKHKFMDKLLSFLKEVRRTLPSKTRRELYTKNWVVYAKAPFAGPQQVIEYLGRYTHKIAISNHRLISMDEGRITFIYKDYADQGKQKRMSLEANEFLRRFCLHILPPGFRKIRHYGFLSSRGKAKLKARAEAALEMVHMDHALDKLPHEISGGMKQRVGIARALAMKPKVLLLDEPFGALDALTRAHLQDEVMRIQADLGNTMMMITHDVDEAVLLSDRIVMMTNGPSATIGEILSVDLPRPRDRIALADDHEYNRCRRAVLSFLHDRHRLQ